MGISFQRLFTKNGTVVNFIVDKAEVAKTDEAVEYNSLFIGTGGNIEVIPRNSKESVIYQNLDDGVFLPVSVKKIVSSGTTASNIIGHKE